jgi:DNA-binding NarL/FixJ family response regulator
MSKLKTYIVEDSPVIRQSLIATLEELAPVEVVGMAEDELTAVQWLTRVENQVNLVIVDIFLKSGSGLGVLRAISTMAHQRRVVVLSNYATPDMQRKCLALGADRVFDKSNDIDLLIQYCNRLESGDNGQGKPE